MGKVIIGSLMVLLPCLTGMTSYLLDRESAERLTHHALSRYLAAWVGSSTASAAVYITSAVYYPEWWGVTGGVIPLVVTGVVIVCNVAALFDALPEKQSDAELEEQNALA